MKPKPRWKRRLVIIFGVLVVLAGAVWFLNRRESIASPFTGAYAFENGQLVLISPRDAETLRGRFMNGESRALRPSADLTYEAGPGWSGQDPTEVTVTFDPVDGQTASGLTWEQAGVVRQARRLELPEIAGSFESHGLSLRAKLVLPKGSGPFPVAVYVHGSERDSAVDGTYLPYMFAAHGIAGLVYDKRGTGGSEGRYSQNFHLLSDDTAAAVQWLRGRPEVDPNNIHLAGYSQGGWIAPLAATKAPVRSLLINFGPMVPVTGEDRWGYVYALHQAGFGEEVIRQVDSLNQLASAIMDRGENRWSQLREALERAEAEPWYETLQGSDSLLGFISSTRLPWWVLRLSGWWLRRGEEPFNDRLYDPVPTADSLTIPSLWIFGDEDSSMPTEWPMDELEKLRAKGRPIEIETFPGAEHGILLFEENDGPRRYIGYPPRYLPLQVDWIRRQSGLASWSGAL